MEKQLVDRFIELIQIPGPSKNERAVADFLKIELQNLGCAVREDNAGQAIGGNTGNLIATLQAPAPTDTTILFSSHMDTVNPCEGIKPVIKDGTIYSDGTTILGADDRAGIAAILSALYYIKKENISHPNIEIVFSVSEELGLLGASKIDESGLKSAMAFVIDCSLPPGNIVIETPHHAVFDCTFHGIAAHAGVAPEKGINAIQIAAAAINSMTLGRIDENTVMNVGSIKGGSATNIIPDTVEITGEMRCFGQKALDDIISKMEAACFKSAKDLGGSSDFHKTVKYGGYNLEPDSPVVKTITEALKRAGKTCIPNKYSGGSDANVFNIKGIPTVPVGMGVKNPHSKNEHIAVENLAFTESIIIEIIKSFTG